MQLTLNIPNKQLFEKIDGLEYQKKIRSER